MDFFDGFSYEVFNEAISTLCMLYHLVFNRLMNGDPLYIHMASRLQDVGEPRSHDRGISSNPSLAVANCPLN
jgi:hypothetical protein